MHNRKPDWLRIKIAGGEEKYNVEALLERLSLHTVCREAHCPNLTECFSRKTATFMILGNVCTRNCTFCNVRQAAPGPVDFGEPGRIAEAARDLGLKYVVITSVTRDDLPDGGAGHFRETIRVIREMNHEVIIEVLIPDFKGDSASLLTIIEAGPAVINHNVETVPRLYPAVRPMALYQRSLALLAEVKTINSRILTKSGIMVGLGETEAEIYSVLEDLRAAGCDLLTIGQYLAPSKQHHPVMEYVHPDVFERYKEIGLKMGFKYIASGPLVRSSYHAERILELES